MGILQSGVNKTIALASGIGAVKESKALTSQKLELKKQELKIKNRDSLTKMRAQKEAAKRAQFNREIANFANQKAQDEFSARNEQKQKLKLQLAKQGVTEKGLEKLMELNPQLKEILDGNK